MNKKAAYIPLTALLLLSSNFTLAQGSLSGPSHNYGWIDIGLGGMAWSETEGDGATVSFSHLSDLGLFTLRLAGGSADMGFPTDYFAADKPYRWEVGALYGRAYRSDFLFASASVGVGIVWGNDVVLSPTSPPLPLNERFVNVGIPAELQAFVNFMPVIAFGGKISLDLNSRSNFYGWFLCLRVGKIREIHQD